MTALSKSTDLYTSKHEHLLFLGDFHAGIEDTSIKNFCNSFNLTSMVYRPACYKNQNKPSFIDLTLTNHPRSFQNTCVIETGLSDFHKMVLTVMKTSYRKHSPKIIKYRDYRYFSNDRFSESLLQRNAPTKHWAFSEEMQIWKIRIFWNELTEKIFFF